MTAIFGTPVAAVLLAVELLLFEWRPRSFIPVAAAAITATLLAARCCSEPGRCSRSRPIRRLPWWGLIACAGLGIVAGLQSGLLTKLLYASRTRSSACRSTGCGGRPSAGSSVGLGGLVEPRALGVGYDIIGDLLDRPPRRPGRPDDPGRQGGDLAGRALVGHLRAACWRPC